MAGTAAPRTLPDKLWDQHRVAQLPDGTDLLHIDRIVLHERSGAPALRRLEEAGRPVFDPALVIGTPDHVVDTIPGRTDSTLVPNGGDFIRIFRERSNAAGIRLFDLGDVRQGIAHVAMPEQGVVLPGVSLICADSHTCTVGALGALAWGVGVTEAEHALATQTLAKRRPKTMRVMVDGSLDASVSAKDIVLNLIGKIGAKGGVDHMVEFVGPAISDLSIEGRMTLCNMAAEFGAWAVVVAPDEKTFQYLAGRSFAPTGASWDAGLAHWKELKTDEGARFDREVRLSIDDLVPQVTWGTSPQHVAPLGGHVPAINLGDPSDQMSAEAALAYMGLVPGQALDDVSIDAVFIGSCTNARLSDLRAAAALLRGRRIAPSIKKAIVVPGSSTVRRNAEAEGLDKVFVDAGFEWRESGCSLCFYAGGEGFPPGSRVASTTNRNFENRQGPGIRTHLMSPASAAASAIVGKLVDPRKLVP